MTSLAEKLKNKTKFDISSYHPLMGADMEENIALIQKFNHQFRTISSTLSTAPISEIDSKLYFGDITGKGEYVVEKSYCTQYEGGETILVLLGSKDESLNLVLIPSRSVQEAVSFEDKQYGRQLVVLLAAIKNQFLNPEDFVNRMIQDFGQSS